MEPSHRGCLKHDVGAPAAAEPDSVSRLEAARGDGVAIDEGAESRSLVPQQGRTALQDDFRVFTRDLGAPEAERVRRTAADRARQSVQNHDPFAQNIGNRQQGGWHEMTWTGREGKESVCYEDAACVERLK